jgi:hypothetical protein
MSPWTDKLDTLGQVHTSRHRDGHKVGLFPDGWWWAYHAEYRYTPPGTPRVGPAPAGPFLNLPDAKRFVEAQGFESPVPFEVSA